MIRKVVRGRTAHEKELEAMEKKLHHLEKEVNFLMEKHYVHDHHPFDGVWGIRGLDWYCGKET